MPKLHYCSNGTSVTDQVIKYQSIRRKTKGYQSHGLSIEDDAYIPIQQYFNEYKDYWYEQLVDYIDKDEFEANFDFKLFKAVETFDANKAMAMASEFGWTFLGMFNRWFYRILAHWKSNIKTSAFRLKKRPVVQCPACGRHVTRITEEHLQHYKTVRDLPSHVVWKGDIYEVCTISKSYIYTWGAKIASTWKTLQNGQAKKVAYLKKRVRWRWYLENGKRGVLCPFTRKIIPELTNKYILTLSDKYNRYSAPIRWQQFIEDYPGSLIQSEIYSLDYLESDSSGQEGFLRDHIPSTNERDIETNVMNYDMVSRNNVETKYEHTFYVIEQCISDETDKDILKLLAIGYLIEDISELLVIDKKEIRKRIRLIRDSVKELELKLIE